jgi:leader peptidase (prepilin peptidase)/N-methyltransferase
VSAAELFEAGIPMAWIGVWLFAVGAALGSFLNVVIARVPAGLSLVRPRSRCPRCERPIAWYDNIPVISWFALRGRCRGCRRPISFRYPLVEAGLGAATLAAGLRHGLDGAALAEVAMVALLVPLAFIDLDTWHLPHVLTFPLAALGLGAAALGWTPVTLRAAAAGAVVGFALFAGIWALGEKVLHRELMGFGDATLLGGIGAWLGLPALLPVVLLGSLQGSAVGLVLMAVGKLPGGRPVLAPGEPAKQEDGPGVADGAGAPAATGARDAEAPWIPPRTAVPFGPFLVLGTLEWLYLGDWLREVIPALGALR